MREVGRGGEWGREEEGGTLDTQTSPGAGAGGGGAGPCTGCSLEEETTQGRKQSRLGRSLSEGPLCGCFQKPNSMARILTAELFRGATSEPRAGSSKQRRQAAVLGSTL